MPGHILLIDDEESLRKLLSRILTLEGFTVEQAPTLRAGRELLERKPIDVVLCDVRLPDGSGVDFVKTVKTQHPLIEIILLTAYGNIPDGVQAIKLGAFDYITKGNDNDRIVPLLYQALDRVKLQRNAAVRVSQQGKYGFEDIIGESALIRDAIQLARKIAPTDANVLLLGETGTGKEVFANAIHAGSKRASHAIVAINCSAFTRELLEGELFGHKAGAFTGATRDKKGLIEMAQDGTLFLDEIGEMNLELQAKLLRVIENKEFIKLGDTKTTHVNVRFICATNRDLAAEVAQGKFREDLYYRLNVFSIMLPPLRDRQEDILPLASHFLTVFCRQENLAPLKIDDKALLLLQQHEWKGNIRELRNVLQRAAILAEGGIILPAQLPFELQAQHKRSDMLLKLADVEKEHIKRILEYTKGNKTRAADTLGIGLTTLYRKMEEYGLQK